MTLIYGVVAGIALIGFVSLAIDVGRVQLVKTELRSAADAAARYAVTGVVDGTATTKAISAAAQNLADGSSVVLTNADVETGNWDSSLNPTFSTSRTPTNAVRITARRSTARGTGVPLLFAQVVGQSRMDVSATAIAVTELGMPSGFIGLTAVTVKNNLFSASYDSADTTTPTQSSHDMKGMIGSNGAITAKHNEVVGTVLLGPQGTHNLTLQSPPTVLGSPIPAPAIDFSSAPASNPNGVGQVLSVSGTTTLSGGTYYFTSITLANNATLKFSGAATLYVNGNVTFSQSGEIQAHNKLPANLKIRQRGSGSTFGGSNSNQVTVWADMEGPETDFSVKNSATLYGRGVFKSIEAKNNLELYYDETLPDVIEGVTGSTSGSISLVR